VRSQAATGFGTMGKLERKLWNFTPELEACVIGDLELYFKVKTKSIGKRAIAKLAYFMGLDKEIYTQIKSKF